MGSGNVAFVGDSRADPSAVILSLLQTPVYSVGEGRIAGSGNEDGLVAAKSGEVLRYGRWVVSGVRFSY